MNQGERAARRDYEQYKKGEISLDEICAACDFARWAAAFGDENFQECGSSYLHTLQELGLIKLKIDD